MPRSMRALLILFTLVLMAAPLAPDAATGHMSRQQAYALLKQGNSPAVRALPAGEREILLAKLALDAGHTDEAIRILSSHKVAGNSLAALIRAEAYRRQSVAAARRAGHYAHAVTGNIGKLQKARLNVALNQAESRLQAFMAGRQLAVALPQRAAVPPKPLRSPSHRPAAPVRSSTRSQLPASLLASIESWRRDWESRNADAYLSHYHPAFRTAKHDLRSWSAYKRRVNARKSYIRVKLSDLRLRRGPEQISEGEGALVTFRQQYQSSNYAANSRKQLYLVRKHAGDDWRILFEGDASPLYRHGVTVHSSQSVRPDNQALRNSSGAWAINIGSFDSAANARQMATGIRISGAQQPFVSSVSVDGKAVHRVRIGLYASRNRAVDAMLKICPELGLSDCWLEQVK